MSSAGAPSPRDAHSAVWTGTEMIVWGGLGSAGYLNDGGRYNPATDTWTALPTNAAVQLTIQPTDTNTVVVSWPSSASARILQTYTDLNTANWGDAVQVPTDNGMNRSIVDRPTSRAFYRLRYAALGSEGQDRPHALLLQVPICVSGVGAAKPAARLNKPQRKKQTIWV